MRLLLFLKISPQDGSPSLLFSRFWQIALNCCVFIHNAIGQIWELNSQWLITYPKVMPKWYPPTHLTWYLMFSMKIFLIERMHFQIAIGLYEVSWTSHLFLKRPYFLASNCLHRPFGSFRNLHNHLPNNAWFI